MPGSRPFLNRRLFWTLLDRWVLAAIAVVAATVAACAEVTVLDPGTFVVDYAGIIDAATERALETLLSELEGKTTAQVKVLTVQTTDGEPVFNFAQRHAERWKLGQRGKDNGALIVVAVAEREVRIQPGYGLEPVLPDSWCGTVARNVFVPAFRAGDYAGGIHAGTLAVANRLAESANVTLSDAGALSNTRRPVAIGRPAGCAAALAPLIILVILIAATRRRRRYRRRWGGGLGEGIFWGMLINDMMRGRRRFGSGRGFGAGLGGGFGGGSFGGGGRFGGGGGGARW